MYISHLQFAALDLLHLLHLLHWLHLRIESDGIALAVAIEISGQALPGQAWSQVQLFWI